MAPTPVPPDDKDWTWVLSRPCPECGFDVSTTPPGAVADRLRELLPTYADALAAPDVRERPAPTTWSALEYGCHVRDVFEVFDERVALLLAEDDPLFENWDQDATAIDKAYAAADPVAVAAELDPAGRALAARLDGVRADQWDRPARRSNGSVFTLATLSQYLLHDVAHHAWDLAPGQRRRPSNAGSQ